MFLFSCIVVHMAYTFNRLLWRCCQIAVSIKYRSY